MEKLKLHKTKKVAKVLHKPIIRKCEQQKVCSSFINNVTSHDLADIQVNSIKEFTFYRIYFLLYFY